MKLHEAIVAVPVNNGMLSYTAWVNRNLRSTVAVPVNYGMLSYEDADCGWNWSGGRSPRQLWNALLRAEVTLGFSFGTSQSPSIMECSPTLKSDYRTCIDRRSPRQLWNALLQ